MVGLLCAALPKISRTATQTFSLPHRGEPRNESNAAPLLTGTVVSLGVDLTMLMS